MTNWNIDHIATGFEAAVAAQFALFSLFCLVKARQGMVATYFLACLSAMVAVVHVGNVLFPTGPAYILAKVLNHILLLLIVPIFYLYIRYSKHDSPDVKLASSYHVLPACIGALILYYRTSMLEVYMALVLLVYVIASGVYLSENRHGYSKKFFRLVIIMSVGFSTALVLKIFAGSAFINPLEFRSSPSYLIALSISLFIAWTILFAALQSPEVLFNSLERQKYANATLSPSKMMSLKSRIDHLMESDKPYLIPELSLNDLAEQLDVSPRHLSQAINSSYEMNFSAFINAHRIRSAANMLESKAPAEPIKAIMYDCGFRSKAIFYREFKKSFGQTPSEYRGQLEN